MKATSSCRCDRRDGSKRVRENDSEVVETWERECDGEETGYNKRDAGSSQCPLTQEAERGNNWPGRGAVSASAPPGSELVARSPPRHYLLARLTILAFFYRFHIEFIARILESVLCSCNHSGERTALHLVRAMLGVTCFSADRIFRENHRTFQRATSQPPSTFPLQRRAQPPYKDRCRP